MIFILLISFSYDLLFLPQGIVSSEGELWKEQRRFTHTVLKDLGMGRGMVGAKDTGGNTGK